MKIQKPCTGCNGTGKKANGGDISLTMGIAFTSCTLCGGRGYWEIEEADDDKKEQKDEKE